MLDDRRNVTCGTMSNLFVVSDNVLKTPLLTEAGVTGVMRNKIIQQALSAGIEARELMISTDDVANASEVFLSNALIGIWPIREIEGTGLHTGTGYTEDHAGTARHRSPGMHRLTRWFIVVGAVVLLGFAAAIVLLRQNLSASMSIGDESVVIDIGSGTSLRGVAALLASKGFSVIQEVSRSTVVLPDGQRGSRPANTRFVRVLRHSSSWSYWLAARSNCTG